MKGSQIFASYVAKLGMTTNIAQKLQIGATLLGNTENGEEQMGRWVLISHGLPLMGAEMKMAEIEMKKTSKQRQETLMCQ